MAISSSSSGLKPGICTSISRPTSPYTGQLIFETDTFTLKFWNGSAWQGAVSAPSGTINTFAGTTTPSGWLLCYGQAISRATYADLYAAIGTTYGTGDGSTTFNIPDLRGRVPAGLDNMGGSAASRLTSTVLSASNTLGATGGTQTHTMSTSEMPSHTHVQNSHGHLSRINTAYVYSASNGTQTFGVDGYADKSGGVADATATNQYTGGGAAHLNTQPTIVLNYIIKI